VTRETVLGHLWRTLGLVAFIVYLLLTVVVLAALLWDATGASSAGILFDRRVLGHVARNSVIISLPAAGVCVVLALFLAYRLRFVAIRHALVAVVILLAPYFSSAIGLYVGLKSLVGGTVLAFSLGLIMRYVPVATIVFLVAMQVIPPGVRRAARNLNVSRMTLFWRVVVPAMRSTMLLVFVFLALLMPLDVTGSTVAGGGTVQIFGNLIADYAKSRDAQSAASALTALFVIFSALVLLVFVQMAARYRQRSFSTSRSEGSGDEPVRTVYLNPAFLLFLGTYVAVLISLLRERPHVGGELYELWAGLRVSGAIVLPVTVMTVVCALFVGCWLHLAGLGRTLQREKLVLAALIIPTLLPPVLAARIGAVAQGFLGLSGDGLMVAAWYLYFFGAIPILVLVSDPLVGSNVLAHVAANHRVTVSDYVPDVLLPKLWSGLIVGGCLFTAIAVSDVVIVRYVGGATKTLGLVLSDHQAGVLSRGDYVFLGSLGLWTLLALLAIAWLMYATEAKTSFRVGMDAPTAASRRS
jgi:ABC-type Fe3+ transport system permease subunit